MDVDAGDSRFIRARTLREQTAEVLRGAAINVTIAQDGRAALWEKGVPLGCPNRTVTPPDLAKDQWVAETPRNL